MVDGIVGLQSVQAFGSLLLHHITASQKPHHLGYFCLVVSAKELLPIKV